MMRIAISMVFNRSDTCWSVMFRFSSVWNNWYFVFPLLEITIKALYFSSKFSAGKKSVLLVDTTDHIERHRHVNRRIVENSHRRTFLKCVHTRRVCHLAFRSFRRHGMPNEFFSRAFWRRKWALFVDGCEIFDLVAADEQLHNLSTYGIKISKMKRNFQLERLLRRSHFHSLFERWWFTRQ